ncbi:cyclic-phosphate processing receiver domain-containing protein [Nitrospira sp. BLG_2]|uniref:cyclic-phosphate processing receiver domain-containing protein n=1 Tax=Nitrospira sp. BLG_2 TaxID=3397507 RepID=UPI003B9B8B15
MNVWLDDERPMPPDYHIHVRTAEDAIALLETGKVTKISLDHDLGQVKTGYDVAKWIEENAIKGTLTKLCIRVHTQNPVGRQNICAACQNAMKYWGDNDL